MNKDGLTPGPNGFTNAQARRQVGLLAMSIFILFVMVLTPLLSVTVYYATEGFSKDIAFASQELQGDEYIKKVIPALRDIGIEKNLVLRNADGSQTDNITAQRSLVNADFAALDDVQAKLGETLQVTTDVMKQMKFDDDRPSVLEEQYNALKDTSKLRASADNIIDIATKYDALLSNIKDLITHVGNQSNLVLDPDLDTYYLMSVVVTNLPINQDRLASIETFIEQEQIKPSPDQKTTAAVNSALLNQFDIQVIDGSNKTVLGQDQYFYGVDESLQKNYPAAMIKYDDSNNKLVDLLERMSGDSPPSLAEILTRTEEARVQSYAMWDEGVQHLDDMLNNRIRWLTAYRNEGLAISFSVFVFVCLFGLVVVCGLTYGFVYRLLKDIEPR